MSQIDVLKIIAKNVGTAVTDTLSFNMGSAIKNSAEEIKEYSKLTNDALYYLQVQKFLETADLDSEEIEDFLKESPDNQRLGLELFKVLEKTHLEKQAELMAISFQKYLKKIISSEQYNVYNHIITQLDRHTLLQMDNDLRIYFDQENSEMHYGEEVGEHDERLACLFVKNETINSQSLRKIGFIEQENVIQKLTSTDFMKLSNRSGGLKINNRVKFIRTKLYLNFYLDIYLETVCTQ